MIPTLTRFTKPDLSWGAEQFFNEFGSHPKWQCAVVHPFLDAGNRLEERTDDNNRRERLFAILAHMTRLAVFDHISRLISWTTAMVITAMTAYFGVTWFHRWLESTVKSLTGLSPPVLGGGVVIALLVMALFLLVGKLARVTVNRVRSAGDEYLAVVARMAELYQDDPDLDVVRDDFLAIRKVGVEFHGSLYLHLKQVVGAYASS